MSKLGLSTDDDVCTGSIKVGLPRDFDGFICLETLVGNTTKTSTLRAHSTPSINHNKKLNCKTFRVRPTLAVDRKNKANYLDMDEHKQNFDFCRVVSYGGLVEIGYMD